MYLKHKKEQHAATEITWTGYSTTTLQAATILVAMAPKFWNWRLDLENSRQAGDREE